MVRHFVERKATIKLKGRSFTSGGGYFVKGVHKTTGKTKDFVFAYLSNKNGTPTITDWHGRVLSDKVRIMKTGYLNSFGEPKMTLRFRMNNKVFSGTNYGGYGAYVKARSTNLRGL